MSLDVELLLVPDCPHGDDATTLLRTALDDVGLATTRFRTTVITTDEEAETRSFAGSPTFLAGGRDLFPTAAAGRLACRLYRTAGGVSGTPAIADLRQALKRAAAESATQ